MKASGNAGLFPVSGAARICHIRESGYMIMGDLGLQLPQEVFKFRPFIEGRREKINNVAF